MERNLRVLLNAASTITLLTGIGCTTDDGVNAQKGLTAAIRDTSFNQLDKDTILAGLEYRKDELTKFDNSYAHQMLGDVDTTIQAVQAKEPVDYATTPPGVRADQHPKGNGHGGDPRGHRPSQQQQGGDQQEQVEA